MPSRTSSRVSDDPLLLSEWHNEKNTCSPYEISLGSAKRCRWICSRCGFRWETPVYSRGSKGCGCPECAKAARGMTKSRSSALRNALTLQFPEVAREWDTQKNMPLRAEETSSFSNRRVWWVCARCQNEWQATVNHRTAGRTGCPICSKTLGGISKSQAAAKANNFSAQHPEIAAEWHPTKNAPLLPEDVSVKCNKKVWWLCSFCRNEWQATVNDRSSGRGCPACSAAQTSLAEQTVYFYVRQAYPDARNRYRDVYEWDIYIPSCRVAIEYDGSFYHNPPKRLARDNEKDRYCREHEITLFRFREPRLPDTESAIRITCQEYQLKDGLIELFHHLSCTSVPDINLDRDHLKIRQQFRQEQRERSISARCPALLADWNYKRNQMVDPSAVPAFSNEKFWWLCPVCGFEWMDTPSHRSSGRGCPCCAGKAVVEGVNDLATRFPEMESEWDYEKNGDLLPTQIACHSNKKVWWLCRKYKHSWQASVNDRTRSGKETSCPFCRNKRILVGFNDLTTTHPDICREWDYAKNGDLKPEEVSFGAEKKVWWICAACGHEWQAFVYTRTKGHGCPVCSRKRISL